MKIYLVLSLILICILSILIVFLVLEIKQLNLEAKFYQDKIKRQHKEIERRMVIYKELANKLAEIEIKRDSILNAVRECQNVV